MNATLKRRRNVMPSAHRVIAGEPPVEVLASDDPLEITQGSAGPNRPHAARAKFFAEAAEQCRRVLNIFDRSSIFGDGREPRPAHEIPLHEMVETCEAYSQGFAAMADMLRTLEHLTDDQNARVQYARSEARTYAGRWLLGVEEMVHPDNNALTEIEGVLEDRLAGFVLAARREAREAVGSPS